MPNTGKITQIIGAVLDIKFTEGHLPAIYEAINITRKNGENLVVEVAQHLGDETVRCIAMGPTDGLVRGMGSRNRSSDFRSGRRADTWPYLQCDRRCDRQQAGSAGREEDADPPRSTVI